MIYVASSWRCPRFESVADALRGAGHEIYDFKHDKGAQFHWHEVGVDSNGDTIFNYLTGLEHPRADAGFESDAGALVRCDTCVLVLPCGRSAHLELGWAVGQGKRTAILLPPEWIDDPELMYKLVDHLAPDVEDLLTWLESLPAIRTCRLCGCTEDRACVDDEHGGVCYWIYDDLCSACVGQEVVAAR
jgi:hypothetical protein